MRSILIGTPVFILQARDHATSGQDRVNLTQIVESTAPDQQREPTHRNWSARSTDLAHMR